MNVNFNGLEENVVTFEADSTVTQAGMLVKMKASGTVEACSAGDSFCGVAVNVRDGYAGVLVKGYVSCPANAEISVGYQKLACSDVSTVSQNESGREYLVIDSDENTVGFIL